VRAPKHTGIPMSLVKKCSGQSPLTCARSIRWEDSARRRRSRLNANPLSPVSGSCISRQPRTRRCSAAALVRSLFPSIKRAIAW
jgi:hypothetical protein